MVKQPWGVMAWGERESYIHQPKLLTCISNLFLSSQSLYPLPDFKTEKACNQCSCQFLHKFSLVHRLSHTACFFWQICRVKLDEIDQCHSINTRLSHSVCGHFIDEDSPLHGGNLHCSFCRVTLNSNAGSEVVRTFHIMITLADEETTKLYSWCTGQSASAILQISPDEFCDLPEVNKTISFCMFGNKSCFIDGSKNKWKG